MSEVCAACKQAIGEGEKTLEGRPGVDFTDPLPPALILTAIVIGFSIQALMLVGVMKLARDNPTLETEAIERSYRP